MVEHSETKTYNFNKRISKTVYKKKKICVKIILNTK